MAYSKLCSTCGHNNRVGVMFCENCGERIVTGILASTQTRLTPESLLQMFQNLSEEEKNDTLKVLQDARAVVPMGTPDFEADMIFTMLVENTGETFQVRVKTDKDLILGRVDIESHNYPDIDLIPYGGYQLGISRVHASLSLKGTSIYVKDLGSSNGTQINGIRIESNQAHQIRDGDRLRFGRLSLRVNFSRRDE